MITLLMIALMITQLVVFIMLIMNMMTLAICALSTEGRILLVNAIVFRKMRRRKRKGLHMFSMGSLSSLYVCICIYRCPVV